MKYAHLPPNKQIEKYQWNHQAVLGAGSFGTVYLGRDVTVENKFVAIKAVPSEKIQDPYILESLKKEIKIMQTVKGANIVEFLDLYQTTNNVYIISEFCNGGDLRKYLTKKGALSESDALAIFVQLLGGYEALMKNNVIHRDLKPENILLNDRVFKLADFGFARWVNDFSKSVMYSGVGTPLYESPQIMSGSGYTTKSDVWSLGIMLYEMLYAKTPWPARSQYELANKINTQPLQFPIDIQVSKEMKNYISLLLEKDEGERLSIEQVIHHPLVEKSRGAGISEIKSQFKAGEAKKVDVDKNLKAKVADLQKIMQNFPVNIEKIFKKYNAKGDGKMIEEEFAGMIAVIHKELSPEEVSTVFKLFDRDANSFITEQEFKELILETDYSQDTENKILVELRAEGIIKDLKSKINEIQSDPDSLFKFFDKSKDSNLSLEEFSFMLRNIDGDLTEKELKYIFLKFDKDNDGEVSLNEFKDCLFEKKSKKLQISAASSLGFINYLKHSINHFGLNMALIFKYFDNGDGLLELDEFKKIVASIDNKISNEDIEAGFKFMDHEGKGFVQLEQLLSYFK